MATTWETPCANRRYTAHFGILVDPWHLDECTECEFCGSCVAHICYRDGASTLLHLDHFKDFATPGEPECGHAGGPPHLVPSRYQPRSCQLPSEHDGKHRARMGWSWTATRKASA
jgi:hypothetical protein